MMKALFVTLLVFVAVTAAIESAEHFGSETLLEVEAGDEPSTQAKEALIETSAKLSMSARQAAREELQEAFINANFDSEWLEQQELLETKTEGSGYGEMKEIMIKVDELEKKIQERLASDLKYITQKRDECGKTRALHEQTLRDLARRITKNNAIIQVQQAKVGEYLASRAKSRVTVSGIEKEIEKVTDQRREDITGYKKRLLKRLKEIDVLHKCNMLVCTEFSDFKDTPLCVEIRKNGTKTEDNAGQVTTTSLRDLLKEADNKEAIAEAAKNMEAAKTEEAAKAAKAAETLKANAAPTTAPKETQKRMSELLELLQSSDLPKRTYAPARRILMMLRTGAAAKTDIAKDIKEMTLPESLVALLQRVVDDQKRETIDYMNQLNVYHKQIVDYGNAIQAEVDRQNDMAARVTSANGHIERARTDNERRSLQRDVTTNALIALIKHCREEDEAYAKRREGRLGELVNIEKLRSLLRVLQNSDLPKCPNDCTNTDQGKCIWKGLYGSESFCACKKGFWGAACEQRMCPGPNGVLYKHTDHGVCSRRGSCDPKADKGTCTCHAGYYHGEHNSCEFKVCPGSGNCNGKGNCDKVTGECRCFSKYYGHDCAHHKCPGNGGALFEANNRAACSGRGACDINRGTCACSSSFTGQYCQTYLCPGNCSGRGTCNPRNGQCECQSKFFGTRCEFIRCPNNCGGAASGSCDHNVGRCRCNHGYSGPACGAVNHCSRQVVNWTVPMAQRNWNWSNCPGHTLLVGVVRLWSGDDTLNSMRYAQCAYPCEGGKIVPFSTCYEHDWTRSFDVQGWSTCNQGFYIHGLLKSTCNRIYCIERVRCCSLQSANGYARCTNFNWWGCLDRSNWCVVSDGWFIRGLYRTSDHWLHNIEEASSCQFRRNADASEL